MSVQAVEIRVCGPSDAFALHELARRTFIETFAKDNRPEDMAQFVAQNYSVEKQLAEIYDPTRRIGIAWVKDEAAGFYHLKTGPAEPSVTGPKPIELLRLYVDSRFHGKGLAASLINRCLAVAREEGFGTLWLGVWERNERAKSFYRKYGFIEVGAHDFVLGQDVQTDLILARPVD